MRAAPLALIALLSTVPALAETRPDPKEAERKQLLDGLAMAPSDEIASRIEARLSALWAQQGGPTAAMMMARGVRNLQSGAPDEAVADLDSVLVLEPELPEAFVRRGAARYEAGDIPGALRDMQEALKREPRQFEALRTLSNIAEAQGNPKAALDAWRQLLEIDPRTENAQKRLRDLTKLVEGESS
jgi:tetratricopeptide (TPR) repeat protein